MVAPHPTTATLDAQSSPGCLRIRLDRGGAVLPAASVPTLSEEDILRLTSQKHTLYVAFLDGDPKRPLILGIHEPPTQQVSVVEPPAPKPHRRTAQRIKAYLLELVGHRRLTLQGPNGKTAIVFHPDGTLELKAARFKLTVEEFAQLLGPDIQLN